MKDKIKKYILPILIIFFSLLFWKLTDKAPNRACDKLTEDIQRLDLQAIIINKFEDRKNHGHETVVTLQQNVQTTLYLIGDISGLYDSICIGDSIYKNVNTMDILLVRDTLQMKFTVDFDCENLQGW